MPGNFSTIVLSLLSQIRLSIPFILNCLSGILFAQLGVFSRQSLTFQRIGSCSAWFLKLQVHVSIHFACIPHFIFSSCTHSDYNLIKNLRLDHFAFSVIWKRVWGTRVPAPTPTALRPSHSSSEVGKQQHCLEISLPLFTVRHGESYLTSQSSLFLIYLTAVF